MAQIFVKEAKIVVKPKIAKISTSKLNLKAQNICIKPLLKPKEPPTNPTLRLRI
jgi:hypothetical protein